jgi:Flp pilus assembly pilin Flp
MPPLRRLSDQRAQTLTEYSLLVGLIAILVAITLPAIGGSIEAFFTNFASHFGG